MRRQGIVKLLNLFIAVLFVFQQLAWAVPVNSVHFDVLLKSGLQSQSLSKSILGYIPTSYISGMRLDKDGLIDILWESPVKGANPSREERAMNVKFFLSALALPDDSLWVNLNAGLRDTQILGSGLNFLELGKVFLAADVELKKDVKRVFVDSGFLDDVLDEAGVGGDFEWQVAPRFWIVPGRIEIVESPSEMVMKRCELKVMADVRGAGEFSDFIKRKVNQMVVPELEKIVNSDERYMPLRQAVRAIVAAMWYEEKMQGKKGVFSQIIDKGVVGGLKAAPWSRRQFLDEYLRLYKLGAIESGWDEFEVIGGGVSVTEKDVKNATKRMTSTDPVSSASNNFVAETKMTPKQRYEDVDFANLSDKVSVSKTKDGQLTLKAKQDISTEELIASALSAMGYAPEGYRDIFEQDKVGDFLEKMHIKSGQTIGGFSKGAEVALNKADLSKLLDELGISKRKGRVDKTGFDTGRLLTASVAGLFVFLLFTGMASAGDIADSVQAILANVRVDFDGNSLIFRFPPQTDESDAQIAVTSLFRHLQNMGVYADTDNIWKYASYNPDTGKLSIPSKYLKKLLGRGIFSRLLHPARDTLPKQEAEKVLSWIVDTIVSKGSIYFQDRNLVISPGNFTGKDVSVLRLLAKFLAQNEMVKSGTFSYASEDKIYKALLSLLQSVGNKSVQLSPKEFEQLTGLKLKGLDPKKLEQWNRFMDNLNLNNLSPDANALSIRQGILAELKALQQFSMKMMKDGLSIISNKGVINADTAGQAARVIANIFNVLRLNGIEVPQVFQADIVELLLENQGRLPASFWKDLPDGVRDKVFQYFTIFKNHITFDAKFNGQKLSSSIQVKNWSKLNPQEKDAVRQFLAEWMYRHNLFGDFKVYEGGAEMPRDLTLPEWRKLLKSAIGNDGRFSFKDIVRAGANEGLSINVNYLRKDGIKDLNTEFGQINEMSDKVHQGMEELKGEEKPQASPQRQSQTQQPVRLPSSPSYKLEIIPANGSVQEGVSLSELIDAFIQGLKTQAGISNSAGKRAFWELVGKILENHKGNLILWAGGRFSLTSEDLKAITEFMNNHLPRSDRKEWTLEEIKRAFENFDVSKVGSKEEVGANSLQTPPPDTYREGIDTTQANTKAESAKGEKEDKILLSPDEIIPTQDWIWLNSPLSDILEIGPDEMENLFQDLSFNPPDITSDLPKESNPWLYGVYAAGGTVGILALAWGLKNLVVGKGSDIDTTASKAKGKAAASNESNQAETESAIAEKIIGEIQKELDSLLDVFTAPESSVPPQLLEALEAINDVSSIEVSPKIRIFNLNSALSSINELFENDAKVAKENVGTIRKLLGLIESLGEVSRGTSKVTKKYDNLLTAAKENLKALDAVIVKDRIVDLMTEVNRVNPANANDLEKNLALFTDVLNAINEMLLSKEKRFAVEENRGKIKRLLALIESKKRQMGEDGEDNDLDYLLEQIDARLNTPSSTARAGRAEVKSVNQAADGKWQIRVVDSDGSEKVLIGEDTSLSEDILAPQEGENSAVLGLLSSSLANKRFVSFDNEGANLFGFYDRVNNIIGIVSALLSSDNNDMKQAARALLAHEATESVLDEATDITAAPNSVSFSYKGRQITINITEPSAKALLQQALENKDNAATYKHYIARAIVRQAMPEADRLLSGYIADRVGKNLKEKLDNLLYDEGLDELPVSGDVSLSELMEGGETSDMLQGLISAIKENKANDFILENIASDTSEQFDSDVKEIMNRFNSGEINEQEAAFLVLDAISRHSVMPDIENDDYAEEKAANREMIMNSIRVILFNVAGKGDVAQDTVTSPELNYSRIGKVMAVRSELIQRQPEPMPSRITPAEERQTGGIMLAAMSLVTVPM